MLYKRILTAAILIPLVLLAIFYLPELYFQLFLGLIMLGCAWEWFNLMKLPVGVERFAALVLFALLCLLVRYLPMAYLLEAVLLGLVYLCYCVHRYQQNPATAVRFNIWSWYVIGLVLFLTTWLSISIIRFRIGGISGVLMLLLIVWLSDTAAYFTGRAFGKRKLASNVSPNKSWEGIYGAAAAVLLLTLIETLIFRWSFFRFIAFLVLNNVTFVISVYGDLFESMMKRIADCKDSGGLLPGHGGLLDRLDSLFFAAPCFALGLLLMQIFWGAAL